MNRLDERYDLLLEDTDNSFNQADIVDHLPTLRSYADQCEYITEFGAREGISTTAFLAARPKRVITYDLGDFRLLDALADIAKEEGLNFKYIKRNTIQEGWTIDDTDLLFIDTFHVGPHLAEELKQHADKVRKYIILHDTESYGWLGQCHMPGLMYAIRFSSIGTISTEVGTLAR